MNDEDKMTIDEWNETRILVDEYVEELDRKQLSASLEPKTPREIELRKLASILYEHATKIEPEITDDIREISNITNGQMLGKKNLETGLIEPSHVLKEKHGLERKILADSEAYHGDLVDAMKGIRDSVRYTIIFDDDYYVAGVDDFLHQLEQMGYYDLEVKNTWGSDACQGINTKLKAKDGSFFEIQFHTDGGYYIKEKCTRKLYRVIRDGDAPLKLKYMANKLRKILQTTVRVPVGALEYRFDSSLKRR